MANPDGVIHGNSRANLKGYDINRCWNSEGMGFSIEVEAIYKYILGLQNSQQYVISYIVDLHGHSKEFDVFGYFNEMSDKNRMINYMLSRKCKCYNYYKSKFGITTEKKQSFRGQMFCC
jgi:murein tripeptide amidase MpaA